MGRPSKLTPEVRERIVQALVAGNYRETASRYAGIDPRQFSRWMSRGEAAEAELERLEGLKRGTLLKEVTARRLKVTRKVTRAQLIDKLSAPEEPYRLFAAEVELALAEAEVRDIAVIEKAAQTQWQAAAWRLERMHPDRFGRKERLEHSGELRLSRLSDEELDDAIRRLKAED